MTLRRRPRPRPRPSGLALVLLLAVAVAVARAGAEATGDLLAEEDALVERVLARLSGVEDLQRGQSREDRRSETAALMGVGETTAEIEQADEAEQQEELDAGRAWLRAHWGGGDPIDIVLQLTRDNDRVAQRKGIDSRKGRGKAGAREKRWKAARQRAQQRLAAENLQGEAVQEEEVEFATDGMAQPLMQQPQPQPRANDDGTDDAERNSTRHFSELSTECQQSMCDYLKDVLSCEAYGADMPGVCAEALLGAALACPDYKKDITKAPSVCSPYFANLVAVSEGLAPDGNDDGDDDDPLPPFVDGDDDLIGFHHPAPTADEIGPLCEEECFYESLQDGATFTDECSDQVQDLSENSQIFLLWARSSVLRDDLCVENNASTTCVDFASSLLNTSAYGPLVTDDDVPGPGPEYGFSYTCTPRAALPSCDTIEPTLCCAGNIVSMSQWLAPQEPVPPCYLRYLQEDCNMSLTDICTHGTLNPSAVFQSTLIINSTTEFAMTQQEDVVQVQGAIAAGLQLSPSMVSITDYRYNATVTSLSDVPQAEAEGPLQLFVFQLTILAPDAFDIGEQAAQTVTSPAFVAACATVLGVDASEVAVMGTTDVEEYDADPLEFSAASLPVRWTLLSLLMSLLLLSGSIEFMSTMS